MKYIISNYNFIILTINIALVVLIVFMCIIYWNYPVKKTVFPFSMNNCPDNWEVTADGKCIIPSADIQKANIGDLRNYKYPVYKLKMKDGNGKSIDKYTYLSEMNFNGNTIQGEIYKDKAKNTVYLYDISGSIPESAYRNAYHKDDIQIPNTIDFNSRDWSRFHGVNSRICQVQKWIKQHNIQWDGLTQYNQCNVFKQSDDNIATPSTTFAKKQKTIPAENSNMYGEKNDIFIKV